MAGGISGSLATFNWASCGAEPPRPTILLGGLLWFRRGCFGFWGLHRLAGLLGFGSRSRGGGDLWIILLLLLLFCSLFIQGFLFLGGLLLGFHGAACMLPFLAFLLACFPFFLACPHVLQYSSSSIAAAANKHTWEMLARGPLIHTVLRSLWLHMDTWVYSGSDGCSGPGTSYIHSCRDWEINVAAAAAAAAIPQK